MNPARTNLLPTARARQQERVYLIRLAVVALALLTLLILTAAILLVPTYIYLRNDRATKQARLYALATTASSTPERDGDVERERVRALLQRAGQLRALDTARTASAVLRDALSISHPDIVITNSNYTRGLTAKPDTLTISGIASSREALLRYQQAAQAVSFVTSAQLPVSAYAKDVDISFTITLSLAP